jgi:putative heme transporter
MSPAGTARVTSRDVWIVLVNVLALALLVLAVWKLRTIVAWIVLGLFVALAFAPAVRWLVRRGWKRGLAVVAVFLAAALVVGGVIALFVPMLAAQGRDLIARGPELFERFRELAPIRWADEHFDLFEKARTGVGEQAGNVAQPALAFAGNVLEAVAGTITVFALAIFFLLFGAHVFDQALMWMPLERRARAKELAVRMSRVVSGYVAGTAMVATIGGVVLGTTLAILGVPFFVPLGLLMILLGVVPILGSTIAAVVLIGVTFATSGSTPALILAGVYLVYQQVENHLLHPLVQTRTLKMNPLYIALALLVGTGLAGVLGAVLALPVAGALQVFLGDVLARRTGGQPAETGTQVGG